MIDDELVDALLSIVRNGDEPEELRAKAVISMGPVLENSFMEGFEDTDDAPIAEGTFHRVQESLRKLYVDAAVPKEVRRRVLEASVRSPQYWHRDAILTAYSSDDEAWRLTAVFCMIYVRGFEEQILESLEGENPDIHYEAAFEALEMAEAMYSTPKRARRSRCSTRIVPTEGSESSFSSFLRRPFSPEPISSATAFTRRPRAAHSL